MRTREFSISRGLCVADSRTSFRPAILQARSHSRAVGINVVLTRGIPRQIIAGYISKVYFFMIRRRCVYPILSESVKVQNVRKTYLLRDERPLLDQFVAVGCVPIDDNIHTLANHQISDKGLASRLVWSHSF